MVFFIRLLTTMPVRIFRDDLTMGLRGLLMKHREESGDLASHVADPMGLFERALPYLEPKSFQFFAGFGEALGQLGLGIRAKLRDLPRSHDYISSSFRLTNLVRIGSL